MRALEPHSTRRTWLSRAAVLAFIGTLAAGVGEAQTTEGQMQAIGGTSRSITAGSTLRLEVRLTFGSQPAAQVPVNFQLISGPGGVSGLPNPRLTDGQGIAFTEVQMSNPGSVRIDANAERFNTVSFFITVNPVAPPPPVDPVARLERVTPENTTLVLGDRQTFQVRVLDAAGQPVQGVALTWRVDQSPGSPRAVGTTTASNAAGIATGDFGFSVAGATVISAAYSSLAPVRFNIQTQSLGELTPDNRSYRSVGAAFDAICQEVFATPDPEPTPLCVFMTGTLTTRTQRTQAVQELTATGLGAQTEAAVASLGGQLDAIASRLSALRGGALRQSLSQIALTLDGGTVSDGLLASAWSEAGRRDAFRAGIERSFLQLYAGLDAAEAPATAAPAVQPKRERPWGFFLNGRLSKGEKARGVDETGFDFDTAGVTIGFDRAVGSNSFFGFALSALETETGLADAGGDLDTSGLSLTLYGIWEGAGNGYFQASATYGQNQYEQTRRIELPVLGTLTARADFDGEQLASTLEGGWSWDGPRGTATLFGRGHYARAEVDGFRERGAVATLPGTTFVADFGLELEAQTVTSLVGEVGIDLSRVFQFSGGLFVPQINASYLHEFDDDGQGIRGRFLGDVAAGSGFVVFTDDPDRDFFNVGASLRFQFLWGSLFVAYDRELGRDDFDFETVNAGLRFEF